MSAVERAVEVLAHLRRIKGPCPSDAALASALRFSEQQVADLLVFLEPNGMIRIDRRIAVLARGDS